MMNSGRSLGRQVTSTSVRLWETLPPAFTPFEVVSLSKCRGTIIRSLSPSVTRWKSMCRMKGFAG
jgi:hypothetical protein